jgi:carbon monoxide dehydrogenase subunit G
MPSVSNTVEIGVPQDEAFALATDPARFEEWLTLHSGWPNGVPGPPKQGSEFAQKLVIMGMPAEVAWTVEELDAPSKLVMRGAGPMGATLATTVTAETTAGGARVCYEATFEGGGLAGPMGEMVTKQAGTEIAASLEKLKALVG